MLWPDFVSVLLQLIRAAPLALRSSVTPQLWVPVGAAWARTAAGISLESSALSSPAQRRAVVRWACVTTAWTSTKRDKAIHANGWLRVAFFGFLGIFGKWWKKLGKKKKKLLCTQELIAPSFQRVCIHSLASLRFVFPWGLLQHLPRWEPALQPSPWSGHLRGLAYSISTCLDPSSNVSLLKLAGGFPNY